MDVEDLRQSLGDVVEVLMDEIEHSTSEQQNNGSLNRLEYRDGAEADRCLGRAIRSNVRVFHVCAPWLVGCI